MERLGMGGAVRGKRGGWGQLRDESPRVRDRKIWGERQRQTDRDKEKNNWDAKR